MTSRTLGRATNLLSILLVLTLVAACGKKEERSTAPVPSSPPAQAAQPVAIPAPAAIAAAAPSSGPVLASAQYSADPDLRCDLLEVKRASGGALLVRWRIVNTAGTQSAGLAAGAQAKTIVYSFGWVELYFIDPAENKKYGFLTDAEGNRVVDVFEGHLPAGQQRLNWAKFPAPPTTSTKISVSIPKFAPFEDVPVS